MTEEEKNIVLLGSRYETMNMYVDLSNDDGTISKGIAEAMQVYAERYHIAQTKKLHQPTVISAVCNSPCCKEQGVFDLPLGSEWYCEEHYKQTDL